MSLATFARHARIAAAAAAALSMPAAANDYVETEALFHARAIEEAWDTLADHITADSTAAVSWPGTTPPASTGWLADWTARGLGALYCDNVLLVHVTTTAMKGVGTNLAALQLAPHLEAKVRNRDVPPLHWLETASARGVLGRESVTLPACMSPVPSDRPAIAGAVVDPFTVTTNQVTHERQARACPAGFHGTGQTFVREVIQQLNGRGDPTGAPTNGAWSLLVDHCRADTVSWEYHRQSCTFTPGAPHVGTLTGEAVWRRQKSVTGAGTSYGAPEFVSTTCWTDPSPTPPVPRDWTSTTTSRRTVACPPGQIGQRTQRRTTTWLNRQWPWDAVPTVTRISGTSWTQTASTCRQPPPPPPPPPKDPPPQDPPTQELPQQCPPGQVGTPPNCTTAQEPPKTKPCYDRDKGGGCPTQETGNSAGRDGGLGGGWDTDGDGKADVAELSQVEQSQRSKANFIQGHTPIGRDRDNGGGNRGGDGGGSVGGGPGGNRGSGDRGR